MISLILSFVIFFLCIILFYTTVVKPHRYWKQKSVLQASTVWLFGESWKNLLRQESFAESIIRIYRKFPTSRYFGTYQFNTPIFVVRDIELIKKIVIKDFEYFVDHRVFIPESVDPLWGGNLFSLEGKRWRDMRVLLSPAFTSSKMKNMFNSMKDAAEDFVKYFEAKSQDTIELDFRDTLNRYTCDVIATTAYGIKVNSMEVPKNDFYQIGLEFSDFTGWRSLLFMAVFIFPEWMLKVFGIRIFSKRVTDFFNTIVQETIKTREEKGIIRPDMIHLLMEVRKGKEGVYTEEESVIDTGFATATTSSYFNRKTVSKMNLSNLDIAAQASVFFFGGFDTISTTMRFLVYELAVNPDIQNKLRDEINRAHNDCQGVITYEALMKMKYMDMVVSETLRKWSSAILLERVCTKPYQIQSLSPEEKDITIEKGTLIWIPVMGIHNDQQYYPNPERFDPERFDNNIKSPFNSDAFMPFGIGPRNCIGSRFALMELKVFFFHLLGKFAILPIKKSKIPIKISRQNFTLDGECFWFGLKKLNIN